MCIRVRLTLLALLLAIGSEAAGQHIIAHRGASHAAPENTLAAFHLAWKQNADGIEGDFRLSADGEIVCIHDADTERVAGQKLVVSETPFDKLRGLDVGRWKGPNYEGERIPTLVEVLATVPRGKLFFVELKTGPEIVAPLEQTLAQSVVPHEQIVIISFNRETIAECERRMPHLETYWLTSYKQKEGQPWKPTAAEVAKTIEAIGADGLGSKALPEHVDDVFIARLRTEGIGDFGVWTVDDPAVGRLYQDLGAWSITTNRPRYLRKHLSKDSKSRKTPAAARSTGGGDRQ